MKKRLSIIALFASLTFALSFGAQLPPLVSGGGLVVVGTCSTHIGDIAPHQTFCYDLVTATVADVEIKLINNDTNQVVSSLLKIWDYYTDSPWDAWVVADEPITFSSYSSWGMDMVDFTGIPAGNYRVDMNILVPDYWANFWPYWWYVQTFYTNYFDPYAGYGTISIDVGSSWSDIWSWGAAGLILY